MTITADPRGRPSSILVVGIGNVIRTDDGLGVQAMQRLAADAEVSFPEDVRLEFVDGGTRGLELVNDAAAASHVLILDAIDTGANPGALVSISGEELATLPGGGNVHQLGIVDWAAALVMLTGRLPHVRVLGLQPADTGWGTTLTPVVQQQMETLLDAARAQLRGWIEGEAQSDAD